MLFNLESCHEHFLLSLKSFLMHSAHYSIVRLSHKLISFLLLDIQLAFNFSLYKYYIVVLYVNLCPFTDSSLKKNGKKWTFWARELHI